MIFYDFFLKQCSISFLLSICIPILKYKYSELQITIREQPTIVLLALVYLIQYNIFSLSIS